MSKTAIARIRMTEETYAKWQDLASIHHKDLGPYLLERLEAGERVEDELRELRVLFSRLARPGNTGAQDSAQERGAMLEMLLILRQIGGPQKSKIAQAEVQRLGFSLWQFDKDQEE